MTERFHFGGRAGATGYGAAWPAAVLLSQLVDDGRNERESSGAGDDATLVSAGEAVDCAEGVVAR
mgnify:FL=1